jgi:hypothetical protein
MTHSGESDMPRPFPGIDPYLEAQGFWEGFHQRLMTYYCDALNDNLSESYIAGLGVRFDTEVRQAWIEIKRVPTRVPVAVIEALLPTNKIGGGFARYLVKRMEDIRRKIHLIELDFLLGGQRLSIGRSLPRGDYYASVARAERRECDVFAWSIRDPLLRIPVPLLAPDPDVVLDLGPVFSMAYDKGRYSELIDYSAPLTLVRKPEDRKWAEGVARRAHR